MRTILICEDERIVALAEKSLLERDGYSVTIASSGERVLQRLADGHRPDLILMDIDLGAGMDGTEAAEQIIERYDIPVVFLSTHVEADIVEKTEGITSFGYVVKNSGETVLLASVRMAFRLVDARRKQQDTEDQLRTQNRYLELYRTAIDGMADYKIAVVDSNYIYRVVSRQFSESYQIPVSQIVGHTVADLVGANVFEDKIRPFISRALAGESLEFRNWFDIPEVGSRYMRVKYYPIPGFDANDTAVAVVIQDSTEKTQSEQRLRSAERRLEETRRTEVQHRAMLSALPDIVFVTDRDGIILDYHTGAPELLAATELEGKDVGEELPSDVAELIREAIRAAYDSGELQIIEYALRVPAGLCYFEDRLVRMDDDRVLGIVRDVTDRKEAENEAEKQVAEKENLLREVQHRIKNTMRTMGSMLSLQADSLSDTPAAADSLRDARSRFQSMEVLYDQLYRTETHNRGSLKAYVEPVVDTVVELFPGGSRVTVQTDIVDLSIDTAILSPIGIIVTELVTNAMKHAWPTPSGEGPEQPILEVTGTMSSGHLRIEVNDNGLQSEGKDQVEPQGGFGISMMRALAEQLRGTITFTRNAGTRATLEFELPK